MAPFHRPSKTCTAISRTWRKSRQPQRRILLPSSSLLSLVRPIRLSLTAKEWKRSALGRCSLCANNDKPLVSLDRAAERRFEDRASSPPLVNSSFRFRASIIKEGESKGKERRGSDYSTCSLRFIAGQPRVCPPSICLSRGGPLLSPRSVAEDNDDVIGFGSENSNSFTICFSRGDK